MLKRNIDEGDSNKSSSALDYLNNGTLFLMIAKLEFDTQVNRELLLALLKGETYDNGTLDRAKSAARENLAPFTEQIEKILNEEK